MISKVSEPGPVNEYEALTPLFECRALTEPGGFTDGIEGPAVDRDGNLYVVNYQHQGTIGRVSPEGVCDCFVELPAGSVGNGIRIDRRNRMFVADYAAHHVYCVDLETRQLSIHAFNPAMYQPNDLSITRDGTLFASDPDWSTSTGQVWRIDTDGSTHLLEAHMGTTNGIEVSPCEKRLYVNESVQRRIWAYDLTRTGELLNKRLLIEFSDHGLDGMRCDIDGNLYVTRYGCGLIAKVSPEGQVVTEIEVGGRQPTNLAFGGTDGRTCYVCVADLGNIHRFRVDVPGRAWPMLHEDDV